MRVLLVEDDYAVSQSIETMLKKEGMIVDTTDLGEDGLEIGTATKDESQGTVILYQSPGILAYQSYVQGASVIYGGKQKYEKITRSHL